MNRRGPLITGIILACILSSYLIPAGSWCGSSIWDHMTANAGGGQYDVSLSEPPSHFLGFIQNEGQLKDDRISFYSMGGDISVGFGPSSITYARPSDRGVVNWLTVDFLASRRVLPVGQSRCEHSIN
ncbi:MAG: hypothetical protein ACFFD6_08480, partial [Candidatus Thorarchaeota archaeon]